jgi:hypothetical protein
VLIAMLGWVLIVMQGVDCHAWVGC